MLFKAPVGGAQSAADAAKHCGIFPSVLCATYWLALDKSTDAAWCLPRFAPAHSADSMPGSPSGNATWQPDESGAIDVVGAKVTVTLARSSVARAAALALDAKPFTPAKVQHRFCYLATQAPEPAARKLAEDAGYWKLHEYHISIAGVKHVFAACVASSALFVLV